MSASLVTPRMVPEFAEYHTCCTPVFLLRQNRSDFPSPLKSPTPAIVHAWSAMVVTPSVVLTLPARQMTFLPVTVSRHTRSDLPSPSKSPWPDELHLRGRGRDGLPRRGIGVEPQHVGAGGRAPHDVGPAVAVEVVRGDARQLGALDAAVLARDVKEAAPDRQAERAAREPADGFDLARRRDAPHRAFRSEVHAAGMRDQAGDDAEMRVECRAAFAGESTRPAFRERDAGECAGRCRRSRPCGSRRWHRGNTRCRRCRPPRASDRGRWCWSPQHHRPRRPSSRCRRWSSPLPAGSTLRMRTPLKSAK